MTEAISGTGAAIAGEPGQPGRLLDQRPQPGARPGNLGVVFEDVGHRGAERHGRVLVTGMLLQVSGTQRAGRRWVGTIAGRGQA